MSARLFRSGLPSSAPFGPQALGAGFSSPRCPLRAADDFWMFLSFVKIKFILRTFHENIRGISKDAIAIRSLIHFIRGRFSPLYSPKPLSLALEPVKNRQIIQYTIANANN